MAEADERAAPGHYELTGADGSVINIAATADGVTVYQGQAGTTGRGAASLTADEADDLAAAISAAGKFSRDQAKQQASAPADADADADASGAAAPPAAATGGKAKA